MILTALFLKAKLYILALPFVFTMTGASMNQAVLAANGGKFPVMLNDRAAAGKWHVGRDGFIDDLHCRMTDQTHLNFLADYINLKVVIESPGDLLIEIGEALGEYALTVWFVVIVMELNRRVTIEK